MTPIGDNERLNHTYDAIVIGAGVGGASAAIGLLDHADVGASTHGSPRVLVVERSHWPRRKVCGCCVNAAGVGTLNRLGVLDRVREECVPVHGVELRSGASRAELRAEGGLVIDRRTLDAALVERAIDLGAEFRSGCSARIAGRDGGMWIVRLTDSTGLTNCIGARVVIAADGLGGSALAALDGVDVVITPHAWMGLGAIIDRSAADRARIVEPGVIRMCVARGAYVGLVRLCDGSVNLGAAASPAMVRECGGPDEAISRTLRSCGIDIDCRTLDVRGTSALTRHRARIAAPGLLVVGDAAGYIEPFTGEGMAWALAGGQTAGALARAAIAEPTEESLSRMAAEWTNWHNSTIRPRQLACRGVRTLVHAYPIAHGIIRLLGASGMTSRLASAMSAMISRPYPSVGHSTQGAA